MIWTTTNTFLIPSATLKTLSILEYLNQSKIIKSLLQNLNLSSDMILISIRYLIENPSGDSLAADGKPLNFEDVD